MGESHGHLACVGCLTRKEIAGNIGQATFWLNIPYLKLKAKAGKERSGKIGGTEWQFRRGDEKKCCASAFSYRSSEPPECCFSQNLDSY